MDSLTQMVLGAAMGEVVAGKKIGNRALLWGAIGGTIPDLDVLSRLFYGEIHALIIHRGFMHSFLFAFIISPIMAWYCRWFYAQPLYRQKWYKWILGGLAILLLTATLFLLNTIYRIALGERSIVLILLSVLGGGFLVYRIVQRYARSESWQAEASWREWLLLFLLSVGTHPILDCFTTYGTQILLPFTNHAVSFNTISVADPMYTIPFGLCLIIAAFQIKGSERRAYWNWAGIVLSSLYLCATVVNKVRVNQKFEQHYADHAIQTDRYMTTPTILQNLLWYGLAENEEHYVAGYYSILDRDGKINALDTIGKNHELLQGHEDDPDIRILRRFSKGYYNVLPLRPDSLQLNDLRFGTMSRSFDDPEDYVFKFVLYEEGKWLVGKALERGSNNDTTSQDSPFGQLYRGIMDNEEPGRK